MSNPGHNQERIPTRQVDLYEATPKIQVRSVRGRFADLRSRLRWGFLLVLMAGPWLTWNDRQALLFDLPERQFHVFGLTFFPQDFILVSGLLIIGAFALFAVTNWLGRVWCGYTCPHSVWFQMFIDIEQWIEGPRHRRIRQDEGSWTGAIWRMKVRKWLVWAALAVVTGVSIVGYFVPVRELIPALATLSLGGWALFWVGFFVTATFGMGAILREQVCLYMCPYARFQSAMFDPDTLIVSYDPGRGEPRGPRPRKADPQELGLGDCIDCELCVQVCPVGIDIRDGLQYECISCAHCIDACDGVMERMGYAPGLISYTTENRLEGRHSPVLRPRLIGYGLVLAIMIAAFGWLALARGEAELDVLRDRGSLYREVIVDGEALIENAYSLRVVNKTQQAHVWQIDVTGLDPVRVMGETQVRIAPGQNLEVPIRLQAPRREARRTGIVFRLRDGDELVVKEQSSFLTGGGP